MVSFFSLSLSSFLLRLNNVQPLAFEMKNKQLLTLMKSYKVSYTYKVKRFLFLYNYTVIAFYITTFTFVLVDYYNYKLFIILN